MMRWIPAAPVALVLLLSLGSPALASGWHWDHPLPQGDELEGVWGSGAGDVFAVGGSGTIQHFDGSTWSAMVSGTSELLFAVWGNSGSDVFAVGESGTIQHFDGSTWSSMTSGTNNVLTGVWGSGKSVFAVGGGGTILHYDGNAWSAMAGTDSRKILFGVWGASAADVFAVGADAFSGLTTILHYDGSTWSAMTSGPYGFLHGVWGSSGSDVFAVGDVGNILHYDGSTWSAMTSGTNQPVNGVWGRSGSDVFAVSGELGNPATILHYNGSTWSPMANPRALFLGVWGSSGSDVFAVGDGGAVWRYNGHAWAAMSSSFTYDAITSVWGASGSDVFAVAADGFILHYDGRTWSADEHFFAAFSLLGVWGSDGSDVFAVGDGILHYDGSAWSVMDGGTYPSLFGVWGSDQRDVFAVGLGGTILHYDGTAWSIMTSGTSDNLYSVWGSSGSDVFAVSDSGTILHYDGRTWSPMTTTSGVITGLEGVWGSSASDVYAVGTDESSGHEKGLILHYDGSTWSAMIIGTTLNLRGVWGSSARDVFVAGGDTILHYDGSTWSPTTITGDVGSVWGSSGSNVFGVGGNGTILHYSADCAPGDAALCLNGGRFEIEVAWRTPDGTSGPGHAVSLTGDTGYFWFFNSANVELVVKALDACGFAGAPRFWVFAGGLTNVDVTITARDAATGQVRTYHNPPNTPFEPIQDTDAFATCGVSATTPRRSTAREPDARSEQRMAVAAAQADVVAALASLGTAPLGSNRCTPTSTALCLNVGRFRVEATYGTSQGLTGQAQVVQVTPDTGYLWFFAAGNVEAVVKVLDSCALNQRFWVFAGGLTDVEVELRVTDTSNGTVRTYSNPLGATFAPIQDTGAFATCP